MRTNADPNQHVFGQKNNTRGLMSSSRQNVWMTKSVVIREQLSKTIGAHSIDKTPCALLCFCRSEASNELHQTATRLIIFNEEHVQS